MKSILLPSGKWTVLLITCTMLYSSRSLELFHLARLKLYTYWTITPHFSPSSWQPPFYFLFLWLLTTFDTSHKWNLAVIILWLLISLSITSSRGTHVFAHDMIFFSLMVEQYSTVYITTFSLSVCSSVDF